MVSAPSAVHAVIGLGGNVGDTVGVLRRAFGDLAAIDASRLLRTSRLYRTPAWGFEAQPDFVNAVALLETALEPHALLEALLRIERRHGRDRGKETRWGPRTLDLDLLLYGERRMASPDLVVPHPRMHERAFVLRPMLDIAPEISIPGRGPVAGLLAALDAAPITPVDADAQADELPAHVRARQDLGQ